MIQAPARRTGLFSRRGRLVFGLALMVAAPVPPTTAAETVALSIDVSKPGAKMDRNLFGQFAEHLGYGVY